MSYCGRTYTFIHIPKTGGNSIKHAVGKEESGHQSIEHIICDGDYFGVRCDTMKPFVAFIRNPYDRLVSAWAYSIERNMNRLPKKFKTLVKHLDKHIHKLHLQPQTDWLKTERNVTIILYHFETIGRDFADMQLRFGFAAVLKQGNASNHKHWATYYTPEMREKVYQHYLADFLAFGYPK